MTKAIAKAKTNRIPQIVPITHALSQQEQQRFLFDG